MEEFVRPNGWISAIVAKNGFTRPETLKELQTRRCEIKADSPEL
jgi:membrane-bound lytic murein transglycosylase MltF